jgi:hypothetical protein
VTENAATESVEFLEVGTQLRIRPFIAEDGMIRMEIHPELSSGAVRIEGGFTLPNKDVTQVTTNIMCHDGGTVIIGGLIREDLKTSATQIPVLGSLPLVGVAFRQKVEDIERSEIIVLLTPRIVESPAMHDEARHASHEWQLRQENYADKMSPIGKRYWGRNYLRKARAAWNAGDGLTALRYANLAIHFDPMDREAATLRDQVFHATGKADRSIHAHLKEGLIPPHKPHYDYSKQGKPWDKYRDPDAGLPMIGKNYDQGQAGRSTTIAEPSPAETIEVPVPQVPQSPLDGNEPPDPPKPDFLDMLPAVRDAPAPILPAEHQSLEQRRFAERSADFSSQNESPKHVVRERDFPGVAPTVKHPLDPNLPAARNQIENAGFTETVRPGSSGRDLPIADSWSRHFSKIPATVNSTPDPSRTGPDDAVQQASFTERLRANTSRSEFQKASRAVRKSDEFELGELQRAEN